jgi:hypothetical protein
VARPRVEAKIPPSERVWALVERSLTRRIDGFAILFPAALACETPDVAQLTLQIIKNWVEERSAPIPADAYRHLLEFLRRPNLQELALAILDKTKELATLAPVLVKAPLVIAWDNAAARVPEGARAAGGCTSRCSSRAPSGSSLPSGGRLPMSSLRGSARRLRDS